MIADASKECDYLIAYVHWGTEDEDMYNSTQTEHGKRIPEVGSRYCDRRSSACTSGN